MSSKLGLNWDLCLPVLIKKPALVHWGWDLVSHCCFGFWVFLVLWDWASKSQVFVTWDLELECWGLFGEDCLYHEVEVVDWKLESLGVEGEDCKERMRLKSIVLCSGTGFGWRFRREGGFGLFVSLHEGSYSIILVLKLYSLMGFSC